MDVCVPGSEIPTRKKTKVHLYYTVVKEDEYNKSRLFTWKSTWKTRRVFSAQARHAYMDTYKHYEYFRQRHSKTKFHFVPLYFCSYENRSKKRTYARKWA